MWRNESPIREGWKEYKSVSKPDCNLIIFVDVLSEEAISSSTYRAIVLHPNNKRYASKIQAGYWSWSKCSPSPPFEKPARPHMSDSIYDQTGCYRSSRINCEGKVTLKAVTTKNKANVHFFITSVSTTPISGRKACSLVCRIALLDTKPSTTKEDIIALYPEVFKGLGEFRGTHII